MEDIDDILASVDRNTASQSETTAIDHQQLTRFWVAERAVPELLPWPGPLMDRMMERVQKQISTIEDLSFSASDPSLHHHHPSTSNNQTTNLKLSILQSDLSRTQYLLRSILRQRLAKLTKYSIYYLRISAAQEDDPSQPQQMSQSTYPRPIQSSQSSSSLLSDAELSFLKSHQSLLTTHFNTSFLARFPPNLRRMDDNAGGTSMVTAPENKEVVFVRCLGREVSIVVPAAGGEGGGGDDVMMGVEGYGNAMRRGEVWVVRWEGVRDAWRRGEVEIL